MNIIVAVGVFSLKVIAIIGGVAFYVKGQTVTKLLGPSDKIFKYLMGIPIAFFGALAAWSFVPFLAFATYFVACQIGYGDNNPLTKLVGKRWAIIMHGAAVGAASAPLIGWWCIPAAIVSGMGFDIIHTLDDAGRVKEPWVDIARGIVGTICLIV